MSLLTSAATNRVAVHARCTFAAILMIDLFLAGCSRSQPTAPATNVTITNDAPPVVTRTLADALPHEGGPAGYVGSSSCRECHQDEYASWHHSYHRTMTRIAGPDTVRANFDHIVLTNDDTRVSLSRSGDEFWAHFERLADASGASGPTTMDVPVSLVTGSHHMQVFWVPTGQGNAQVGFPFTWLIPEQRWVARKATFIRPPDSPHRPEVWNLVCCRCHATGVEPHIDSRNHSADTRAGELGIACEACHGPGQRHVQARSAERDRTTVPAEILASEIVHPRKIPPARAAEICGFCHSMKWFDKSENWRESGFRFRPGDQLQATTPVIRPSHVEAIPGLAEYLKRNPDLLHDFFWPDGMIRVSGRDYNGLIESPCYKSGDFSCLSCHSLHQSDPDAQLSRTKQGNNACTQCHDKFKSDAALAAHTHHSPQSSGSDCFNCHMPRTTYGVLKAIRSHQISSPRVEDELKTGRPNACNLCHLDKPLSWTDDFLANWFGQPRQELAPVLTNVADTVRLALAGDAGQRALAAWHLGWEPAVRASGESWTTAVIAQLLDDPYSAVRCVASRSLMNRGQKLPAGYDFAEPQSGRQAFRDAVWETWQHQDLQNSEQTAPAATLVNARDLQKMQAAFDSLLNVRDDRPVRLRE